MRPSENKACYDRPLARVRHATVPWQVFCPLSRSGAPEPFLHPCFRPLQQAVIKAMARGVRAALAMAKEKE